MSNTDNQETQQAAGTNLAVAQPQAKKSLLIAMASKYDMDPAAFQNVIAKTVMPSGATNEQMAAFLLVAHTYDLNPITREIYAFPAKGGGITPVVGIDGWINLAQRRTEFDGVDFEFNLGVDGKVESCTAILYRNDRGRPVRVTEYMAECARQTDPWRSHPRRMLRHKALIQAIRYSFGFSGIRDEDDAEVMSATIYSEVLPAGAAAETPALASLSNKAKALSVDAQPTQVTPSAGPQDAANNAADNAPDQSGETIPLTPSWPKESPSGVLVDARGVPFIDTIHSGGKTCNQDGSWRRRKGIAAEYAEKTEEKFRLELLQVESESAAAAKEPAPEPEPQDPRASADAGPSDEPTFGDIMAWIGDEQNPDELDSLMAVANDCDLTTEERDRIRNAIAARHQVLTSQSV